MTLNKTLLEMALGLALAACTRSEEPGPLSDDDSDDDRGQPDDDLESAA